MLKQKLKAGLPFFLAALALTTPLCGYWFGCGCTWPWEGLFWRCDAVAGTTPPPHCPWCIHPLAALLSIGGSLLLGGGVAWKIPRNPAEAACRTSLGILFFALGLAAGGWITALLTHHPHFLAWPTPLYRESDQGEETFPYNSTWRPISITRSGRMEYGHKTFPQDSLATTAEKKRVGG